MYKDELGVCVLFLVFRIDNYNFLIYFCLKMKKFDLEVKNIQDIREIWFDIYLVIFLKMLGLKLLDFLNYVVESVQSFLQLELFLYCLSIVDVMVFLKFWSLNFEDKCCIVKIGVLIVEILFQNIEVVKKIIYVCFGLGKYYYFDNLKDLEGFFLCV